VSLDLRFSVPGRKMGASKHTRTITPLNTLKWHNGLASRPRRRSRTTAGTLLVCARPVCKFGGSLDCWLPLRHDGSLGAWKFRASDPASRHRW
jgi:hypothetical protein